MLLNSNQFLVELGKLYEQVKTNGTRSVWVTYKRRELACQNRQLMNRLMRYMEIAANVGWGIYWDIYWDCRYT